MPRLAQAVTSVAIMWCVMLLDVLNHAEMGQET